MYEILDLIKTEKTENTEKIINAIQKGELCEYLHKMYPEFNSRKSIADEKCVDDFYKASDTENSYGCYANDGLYIRCK